jgi:nucleobase transporter 1/2
MQSLALAGIGFSGMMDCLHLGFLSLALVVIFSLYFRKVTIPLGKGRRWPVFELCPIILSLLLSWFIAWLLTIGGAYRSWAPDKAAACRTDQSRALELSPWFRVPYPGARALFCAFAFAPAVICPGGGIH